MRVCPFRSIARDSSGSLFSFAIDVAKTRPSGYGPARGAGKEVFGTGIGLRLVQQSAPNQSRARLGIRALPAGRLLGRWGRTKGLQAATRFRPEFLAS